MLSDKKIFLLKGKLQNYDWGGFDFLPQLLHFENKEHKPFAEYWMGAHNSAPSIIVDGENEYPLNELIQSNPEKFLGEKVVKSFGELPYLFKILDVNKMLSIQVHPTKTEAEKGFDAEEKNGISINAKNRNYKDRNHKPEVMIALGEFWLLHGFLEESKLKKVLEEIKVFHPLVNYLETKGIKGLYQYVMELSQTETDNILQPLVKEILSKNITDKSTPEFWIQKLFEGKTITDIPHFDKGIFSIYFFNIVKAEKGEAIFQSAGLPHAYLEGQNVELMANSDNVLRGGLTSKHVDVPELLKHTTFESIVPKCIEPEKNNQEKIFHCPVNDFGISEISLEKGENISLSSASFEIIILLKGNAILTSGENSLSLHQGMSAAILPNTKYEITASDEIVIYKSFVP